MHTDIELMLGGYLIEASATGITFDLNHSQPVPCIFSYPCVCSQKPFFDELTVLFSIGDQILLFLFGFSNDVIQFILLYVKVVLAVSQ